MSPADILWPDNDDQDDSWLPDGFWDEDTSDQDFEDLEDIFRLLGGSINGMVEDEDVVIRSGRQGQLRGVRFSSGQEALLWLFRRGIYLYSTLVKFPDGSWGVAIGDSGGKSKASNEPTTDTIPF